MVDVADVADAAGVAAGVVLPDTSGDMAAIGIVAVMGSVVHDGVAMDMGVAIVVSAVIGHTVREAEFRGQIPAIRGTNSCYRVQLCACKRALVAMIADKRQILELTWGGDHES